MNRVQNAIIARGYVTTRVLAAPQDLKAGLLQFTVIPGHVGASVACAFRLVLSVGFDYLMDDKISNADVVISPIGGMMGDKYNNLLNQLAGGTAKRWSIQELTIDAVELGTIWGLEQLPTYSLGRTDFGGRSFDPLLDRATNPYWGVSNWKLLIQPTVTPEVEK
jgi:hypothetical protein